MNTHMIHAHNLQLQADYLIAKRADIVDANPHSRQQKLQGFHGLSDQVLLAIGDTPLYELDKSEVGLRLSNARNRTRARDDVELSRERMRKIYDVARQMLELGKELYPKLYTHINAREMKGFRIPRRGVGVPTSPNQPTYGYQDVLTVATLVIPDDDLWLRRAQATFCLQAVSGARAHATVTLPLCAIDLEGLWVNQDPDLGVWTKNDDRATTCMLNIAELLAPVRSWFAFLSERVSPTALFFNSFSRDMNGLVPTNATVGRNRHQALNDDYQLLCKIAKIEYRATHGLRRFHINFCMERCKDVEDFMALSHNVMHKKLSTTEIYTKLQEDKQAERYKRFVIGPPSFTSPQQAVTQVAQQFERSVGALMMSKEEFVDMMKGLLQECVGKKTND